MIADVVVLIPAYNPDPGLLDVVRQVLGAGFAQVVVVDDGSKDECLPVFDQLEGLGGVTLLRHAVNQGKGAALKFGFNHILNQNKGRPEFLGVVTADADGQHLAADIVKVAQSLRDNPQSLILGVRAFRGEIPLRSRLGNEITKVVFRLLVGVAVVDTQTGLRGVPRSLMPTFLRIRANRYEFELDMLIKTAEAKRDMVQVPIETVYLEDNKSSHFNPLVDSAKIYLVFLRFIASSLLTAGVDYLVFILTFPLWAGFLANADQTLAASTAMARAASILVNFTINRKYVFKDHEPSAAAFIKFVILVAVMGVVSFAMIKFMVTHWDFGVISAKILAETLLYMVNFATQRTLVFRRKDAH